jgi:hypothetical protein
MDIIRAILKDPKVWSAVILLASIVARYAFPDLSPDVLAAVVGLVVVILGASGVVGVKAEVQRVRAVRLADNTQRLRDADAIRRATNPPPHG